jgi:diadenosine tetraphosphatase ApaH/serine/threonine PP2A family protein phosphatase
MRALLLADVHSNLDALDAVIAHARDDGGFDQAWVAGDIVGYGAEPSAVIARLREIGAQAVAGNHDLAAIGKMGVDEFNPVAADAALWQSKQLSDHESSWLAELPLTSKFGAFTMVHGSLREPEWEYLLDEDAARGHFKLQETPYSLVGHSHLQFIAEETAAGPVFRPQHAGSSRRLGETRAIVNPGSSGQPRDGDPRAGYALYDDDAATVTWHRVEYDVKSAQNKIREAGLDTWLAERLGMGR